MKFYFRDTCFYCNVFVKQLKGFIFKVLAHSFPLYLFSFCNTCPSSNFPPWRSDWEHVLRFLPQHFCLATVLFWYFPGNWSAFKFICIFKNDTQNKTLWDLINAHSLTSETQTNRQSRPATCKMLKESHDYWEREHSMRNFAGRKKWVELALEKMSLRVNRP